MSIEKIIASGIWFSGFMSILLLLAGCATSPRPTPEPIVLSDIPVYACSRTNWDTSAQCMIYPMLGCEEHTEVNALSAQLEIVLKEQGYGIVKMDTYMSTEKRLSVDKIITPQSYNSRSRTIKGTNVWDIMAVYSVQDRETIPFDEKNHSERRYFQVWGRGEKDLPYRTVAENLLSIDAFRRALELDNGSGDK